MITLVIAEPKGGQKEFKFNSGAAASKWTWENKVAWFSSLKKTEQRD